MCIRRVLFLTSSHSAVKDGVRSNLPPAGLPFPGLVSPRPPPPPPPSSTGEFATRLESDFEMVRESWRSRTLRGTERILPSVHARSSKLLLAVPPVLPAAMTTVLVPVPLLPDGLVPTLLLALALPKLQASDTPFLTWASGTVAAELLGARVAPVVAASGSWWFWLTRVWKMVR